MKSVFYELYRPPKAKIARFRMDYIAQVGNLVTLSSLSTAMKHRSHKRDYYQAQCLCLNLYLNWAIMLDITTISLRVWVCPFLISEDNHDLLRL